MVSGEMERSEPLAAAGAGMSSVRPHKARRIAMNMPGLHGVVSV
jgi:hypothetical protein